MVIALFILMFFGSKQIPELMRGLGRATREFKDAMNGIEREVRGAVNVNLMEEEKKPEVKPADPAPAPEGTQQTKVNDGPPVE